jgi:exopolyphosphatase/pppGpp-phosphohydrolase
LAPAAERAAFRERLAPAFARVVARRPERLIFASGSARALQRILRAQGLVEPGCLLPTTTVERIVPMLPAISSEELTRLGVGVDRHATLAAGARLVLDVALALGAASFDVAEGGLREGAAIAEWRTQQSLRSIERLGAGRATVEHLTQHFARFGEPAELPRRALASGQ